jgi:hypothetical protein
MKQLVALAISAAALAGLAAMPGFAQSGAAKAKGQSGIPRMPDGKPDLSGVWDHPRVMDMSKDSGPDCASSVKFKGCKNVGNGPLQFTPAGQQVFSRHDEETQKFDPGVYCMPWGYIRSWNTPSPAEIVQRPDRVIILFEQGTVFHPIFTDGRPHPKDLTPTWFGHSIGHWEGETLVADTIGFNGKSWIDTAEHPSSDALHMVERFTRTSRDTLEYQVTLEDEKYYSKPIKNSRILKLMPPGEELLEYFCEENNLELFKAVKK